MTTRSRNDVLIALGVIVVAVALLAGAFFFNRPRPLPAVDSAPITDAITTDNLMRHLRELESIAHANGGNRKAGAPGHEASVDYVEAQLKQAGYETQRQEFSYDPGGRRLVSFHRLTPSASSGNVEVGTEVDLMGASGEAEVIASVTAVDLNLEGDRHTTSGCEASDFAGFPRGDIALLQRGTCRFDAKVAHAVEAGASAVIIMNQGDAADRQAIFVGSLSETPAVPVLTATFEVGARLAASSSDVTLEVDSAGAVVTENLIADLPGRDERTVVVGAHLDGVGQGPGINDNGSGVAAVLELALQLAERDAQLGHGVRFAFWSGEEDGLHGSRHYVDHLDDAGRRAIEVYLNVDMVGSPNPVPYVYGGFGRLDHPIRDTFNEFLTGQGVEPRRADFRASDHSPFLDAQIPVGGLFSGSYEGEPPADPCYHQSCDGVHNIDPDMLGLMADALAHGVLAVAS